MTENYMIWAELRRIALTAEALWWIAMLAFAIAGARFLWDVGTWVQTMASVCASRRAFRKQPRRGLPPCTEGPLDPRCAQPHTKPDPANPTPGDQGGTVTNCTFEWPKSWSAEWETAAAARGDADNGDESRPAGPKET